MSDKGDGLRLEEIERTAIVNTLETAWARFLPYWDFPSRHPFAMIDAFNAMVAAGRWNRAHPEAPIPPMVNGKVPAWPALSASMDEVSAAQE